MSARALMAALLLPALSAAADVPKKDWKNSAELSVVVTNGNSKTNSIAAKDKFLYDWDRFQLQLQGGAFGAKSAGVVTDEKYDLSEKVSFKFSEKNHVYERVGWNKNRFAGYYNRWDLSGGMGRELLSMGRHTLDGEAGLGFITEERIGAPAQEFINGRLYCKYGFKISETAHFSQDGEFLPNFNETDDYRLNTETALVAALNALFSVKLSYVWNRVGKPAAGFSRDDSTTAVALLANF